MKCLDLFNFSKIGTNPMKYFENFLLHINNLPIGEEFELIGYKLYSRDIVRFAANSSTTIKQNIDAWVWMGFIAKKEEKKFIKIIEPMTNEELIEHAKYSILIKNKNKTVNKHRNTIIIKLLASNDLLEKNKIITYEEILKECGEFEKLLSSDKKYISLLNNLFRKENND